jgi:hypothetical protein
MLSRLPNGLKPAARPPKCTCANNPFSLGVSLRTRFHRVRAGESRRALLRDASATPKKDKNLIKCCQRTEITRKKAPVQRMKKTTKPTAQSPSRPPTWLDMINEERLSNRYSDLPTIVQTALDRGIIVTWDMLRETSYFRRGGAVVTPTFITNFIAAYAAELKPESVLDPWAGLGSTLIPIVTIAKISRATGITPVTQELEVARLMSGEAKRE